MILFEDFRSLYDDIEYIKKRMTLTYDTVVGTLNKFTYDNINRIIRVNSGNTLSAYSLFEFEDVNEGDIVEAEFDVYSMSGILPKILYVEQSGASAVTVDYGQAQSQGVWETVKFSRIATKQSYSTVRILFGLLTADTGEFLMKNVRCVVKRKNAMMIPRQRIETFELKKDATLGWIIRSDFASNIGTISFPIANTFMITFSKPFQGLKTMGFSNVEYWGVGSKYVSKMSEGTLLSCKMKLYLNDGTNVADLSTIETDIHISVMVIGSWLGAI